MSAREAFVAQARERVLVFDGAFGTQIQSRRLGEADYAGDLGLGADQGGNNDILALTRPDVIADITRAYFAAGADMVSTNTFSANRISQADYGAEHLVREIDFDFLSEVYREQAAALIEGGADFVLVETIFDTLNAKAAIHAVRQLEPETGRAIPLMLSLTLTDLSGRNLSGHTVEAFWHAVRHADPLAIGLNCSFGAEQLRPHVMLLSRVADTLLLAYPNAGLPNELGEYDEQPATTAAMMHEWAAGGLLNVVGGCCGSTPDHIAAIARSVEGLAPRVTPAIERATRLAGLEPFTMAA